MHAIFHIRLFYINRLKWKTKPLLLHSIYRPRLLLCYQLATYLFLKAARSLSHHLLAFE